MNPIKAINIGYKKTKSAQNCGVCKHRGRIPKEEQLYCFFKDEVFSGNSCDSNHTCKNFTQGRE